MLAEIKSLKIEKNYLKDQIVEWEAKDKLKDALIESKNEQIKTLNLVIVKQDEIISRYQAKEELTDKKIDLLTKQVFDLQKELTKKQTQSKWLKVLAFAAGIAIGRGF